MGIVGLIILGTVLFIIAVNLVIAYICLIRYQRMMRIVARTVPRERIPADWNRIMSETVIERKGAKKK